jgi:hypothetical protein
MVFTSKTVPTLYCSDRARVSIGGPLEDYLLELQSGAPGNEMAKSENVSPLSLYVTMVYKCL